MGTSKPHSQMGEEEPLKEAGQDWSTGQKRTWRGLEKTGGVSGAEAVENSGQADQARMVSIGPCTL